MVSWAEALIPCLMETHSQAVFADVSSPSRVSTFSTQPRLFGRYIFLSGVKTHLDFMFFLLQY